MNHSLYLGAAMVVLAGCAASTPSSEQALDAEVAAQARQETLDDILDAPLTAAAYAGDTERCLSTYAYRSVEVLDDQLVLFKGNGDKRWINRLPRRCIGLRPNEVLRFEMRSNRVCETDSFRSYDRAFMTTLSSGNCTLGQFQPVTPEQVAAIEVAFEG